MTPAGCRAIVKSIAARAGASEIAKQSSSGTKTARTFNFQSPVNDKIFKH
jgi:hypothetical protein